MVTIENSLPNFVNSLVVRKNVVMPYDEFLGVQEELDVYEDLRCLREAKKVEQQAPTVSIEELKKRFKTPSKKTNTK